MTKKNIAVVGCGAWGKNLVRNFSELGALNTISDRDTEQLAHCKTSYPGVTCEPDYEAVLENKEIEGVVLATPAVLHSSMAAKALYAGKDVFIEKPLALNVADGEKIVSMAEERGRILMVGHVLEYHPAIVRLKELVKDGQLGKIRYIYSTRLNMGKFRTEENVLWSFAPHDISVITSLIEHMPIHVAAHGGYYLNHEIADVTNSSLCYENEIRVHIFVSWLHPFKEQKLVVIGNKAMAVFDDVTPEEKLKLYRNEIEWTENGPVAHKHQYETIGFDKTEPLRLECTQFLECIESRQKPITDGINGLKVLKILDACQASLNSDGQVVVLSEDEGTFIHKTSLVETPSSIGKGTKIWHFCHFMPEVTVGENCTFGQNIFIGRKVTIGNNVKVENNVSVFDGVILEDNVFCGPSCVFTNVKKPRSHISQKDNFAPTLVKEGATIGANATVVCGNTIGRYSFIGAGAVVTADVPDFALVYGNPARVHGWMCECGTRLEFNGDSHVHCTDCDKEYRKLGSEELVCCESEAEENAGTIN